MLPVADRDSQRAAEKKKGGDRPNRFLLDRIRRTGTEYAVQSEKELHTKLGIQIAGTGGLSNQPTLCIGINHPILSD